MSFIDEIDCDTETQMNELRAKILIKNAIDSMRKNTEGFSAERIERLEERIERIKSIIDFHFRLSTFSIEFNHNHGEPKEGGFLDLDYPQVFKRNFKFDIQIGIQISYNNKKYWLFANNVRRISFGGKGSSWEHPEMLDIRATRGEIRNGYRYKHNIEITIPDELSEYKDDLHALLYEMIKHERFVVSLEK
jgi:hypothetical protein